jgi:phosphoglycolate phosphatase
MADISRPNAVDIICGEYRFSDIQAVVFDKDGTLAHTEPYLFAVANARIQALSERANSSDLAPTLRATLGLDQTSVDPAGVLAVAGNYETVIAMAAVVAQTGRPWIEALDWAQWAFAQAKQTLAPKASYTQPLPGVIELLDQLQQSQIPIALLSADTQAEVQAFVETYPLAKYFTHLQGLSDTWPSKVQPGFLEAACSVMQISPSHTLVIGDAASDLKMARLGKAAGFIGVSGGWQRPIKIHGMTVEDVLAADLYQILVKPPRINAPTRNRIR